MSSPTFTPTHLVPRTGLPAWDEPDPARPPVANVDPGLEVQVVERLGDWAKVIFSNGWTAWVDGSLLIAGPSFVQRSPTHGPVSAPMQRPEETVPKIAFSPALIGGGLVAVSSMLPWVKLGTESANAFKAPLQFLFNPNTQASGGAFSIGLILLLLGAGVIAGALLPKLSMIQRTSAGGSLLVVSVFAGQLQRTASQFSQLGGQKVSLFSLMGIGVLACLAGALVAVLFKGKKRTPQ